MSKHAELIARLEAAEVGSRELDALIWDIEDSRPRHSLDGDFPTYKQDPDDSVAFDSPPSYTTSLDAAIALAERVLPLGSWRIEREGAIFWAKIWWGREGKAGHKYAYAKTPAIALCVAILKALDHGN